MVDYISNSDLYEIRLASLISNVDKDVIVELYQPLIGSFSTILYLNLVKQKRNESGESTYETSLLLNTMQFTPGQLLHARKQLEAVGLLKTYEKAGETRSYIYVIYAPKTPKDFFEDVLFKGLLIQYVGEKEAKKLANAYKINLVIPEEYKEISASFVDVYHPNYDDPAFRKEFSNSIVGHTVGRVRIEFNYDLFFKYIEENSQINKNSFYKKDMKEIERIGALYGLNEKEMAFIICDEFDPNAQPHINFQNVAYQAEKEIKFKVRDTKSVLKSEVKGDSEITLKIRIMENTSPAEYLSLLQNNTKPASADLRIINGLSKDYGLSNGIINVVIDYTLYKNNNILSKNYCEKIAAFLSRNNVKTVVDAMNTLSKAAAAKKPENDSKPSISSKKVEPKEEIKVPSNESNKESISDEEIDAILNMIESQKKGGRK